MKNFPFIVHNFNNSIFISRFSQMLGSMGQQPQDNPEQPANIGDQSGGGTASSNPMEAFLQV